MRNQFKLYNRNGVFYAEHIQSGKQESLRTKDKDQAERLVTAKNEAAQMPMLIREVGKAYLTASDPMLAIRTWKVAMDELASHGGESSRLRCQREMESKPFRRIQKSIIIETTADDLKGVLNAGRSSTNNYLRRLHNLALGLGWLHWQIIPIKLWPKPAKKEKRGITLDEHNKIIGAEQNEERRNYYKMLWEIGAAQTDCSLLTAENVNWQTRVLSYFRKKTKEGSHLALGVQLETLLKQLPDKGYLFPSIAATSDKDRSAEFCRRLRLLKFTGISLHSYRYAWAERARVAGYPERFAQAALGHKSRAVHQAYAKNAIVVCPSLEDVERKILPLSEAFEIRKMA
ncbi:MAG: hypothetical protein JWM68_4529 [Verrucomicrobiales bacterium]|nr:hypothetical protein [Verrucomicrobiales bacterium]